tara:strand:+ start:201 stop:437 length:237 start_codon:yes stop_codon:yes gene_type:complete
MTKIISNIMDIVVGYGLAFMIANYGIQEVYEIVRKEALTKVHQGLSSTSALTQQLTCKKFDEEMNLVPLREGHCGEGQ